MNEYLIIILLLLFAVTITCLYNSYNLNKYINYDDENDIVKTINKVFNEVDFEYPDNSLRDLDEIKIKLTEVSNLLDKTKKIKKEIEDVEDMVINHKETMKDFSNQLDQIREETKDLSNSIDHIFHSHNNK